MSQACCQVAPRLLLLLLPLLIVCCIHVAVEAFGANERTWTYTLQHINATSANEEALHIDLRIERIGRGTFALAGDIHINFDLTNETELEVQTYRSSTGSGDYKLQPFNVPRQSIYEIVNNYYQKLLMKSVAQCSNLPQFEGATPPLKRMTYELRKCQISTDEFPQHMPAGYYKVSFNGYGPVEFTVQIFVHIEPKAF